MKKQFFQYIIIAATGCLLASVNIGCKKALDLDPQDRVSDASFWKQPTEFQLAANAFYGYLRTFSQSNSFGDSRLATDLGADRSAYARGTNTVVSTDGNYSAAYSWIRSINYLLEKAKAYPKPAEIAQYVAEAKFFRAYVYFDKLFTSYGGVILVKNVLATASPELTASRASRDETFDFIVQDLEEAIAGLPSENAILAGDKGRVSKEAAQAFLGRITLYEGTWQKFHTGGNTTRSNAFLDKSIVNSNAVIAGGVYQLFAPPALGDSALKYMFILENQKSNPANISKAANREYILAVRYESNNLLRTIPNQISFGALGANMSRNMADMYLSSDGLPIDKTKVSFSRATLTSEFQNRDNRMRYFMGMPNYRYWQNATNWHINWDWGPVDLANARTPLDTWANGISGYVNQQWSAERQVPNSQEGYDYPTIRLAEVLLNYAEAVYERNGMISDADLDKSLNLVRKRVNKSMPSLSNGLVAANGLDMRKEIRRERAVELQGEGFRMDDLKRWYVAHIELTKPLLGVHWTGTEYETVYSYTGSGNPPAGFRKKPGITLDVNGDVVADPATERKFSEKNYLIPIPLSEMQLNPNLAQNSGWQ